MKSREEVFERIAYDPETGEFTWLKPLSNRLKPGQRAGTLSNGYIAINFSGWRVYAHQLAFFIVAGYIPEEIDHDNRVKTDNSWCNLKDRTRSQNMHNKFERSDNKSGATGVFFNKNCGQNPWFAYINVEGKRHSLGYHPTKDAAIAARVEAKQRLVLANAEDFA